MPGANPVGFLLMVFLLNSHLVLTEATISIIIRGAIEIVTTFFDTALSSLEIQDIFNDDKADGSVHDTALNILENIRNELERINELIVDLKLTVSIQIYYNFIGTIYRSIVKSLDALEDYEQSGSQDSLKEFKLRYETENVSGKTLNLVNAVTLSTYVGGDLGAIPTAYAKILRCDMTRLKAFSVRYIELLKNAFFVEYVYVNITNSSEYRIGFLSRNMDTVVKAFQQEFDNCMFTLFRGYVAEDLETAKSPVALHHNSTRRYNWRCNDVFFYESFLGPFVGGQFGPGTHFIIGKKDSFFYKLSSKAGDYSKILIFGEQLKEMPQIGSVDEGIAGEATNGAKSLCDMVQKKLQKDNTSFVALFAIKFDVDLKSEEGCILSRQKSFVTDSAGVKFRLYVYLSEEPPTNPLNLDELDTRIPVLSATECPHIHLPLAWATFCITVWTIGTKM